MPYCWTCGRPLTGEGRFCSACGAPQAAAAPPLAGQAPPPAAAPRTPSPPVGQAPPPADRPRQAFPGWGVAFFVIIAVAAFALVSVFAAPLVLVGGIFAVADRAAAPAADSSELVSGVRSIQLGVEEWRLGNLSDVYPPPSAVTPAGLAGYVQPWPHDPYTGGPMLPTGAPGGYWYTLAPDGHSYTLTGYGKDGSVVRVSPQALSPR
jgi:hypothetical protein